MKTFLAACVAFGALTFTALPHANAEVVVGVPGVHLRVGPPPRPHYADREHRRWEERHDWCYYHDCRR